MIAASQTETFAELRARAVLQPEKHYVYSEMTIAESSQLGAPVWRAVFFLDRKESPEELVTQFWRWLCNEKVEGRLPR